MDIVLAVESEWGKNWQVWEDFCKLLVVKAPLKLMIFEKQPKSLWMLHCKNEKCGEFFDYFGRLRSSIPINCTHCGKPSRYDSADFVRHNSVE